MLNISHTRLLAAALGCLAIAAASISLADDKPSDKQANQPPAATQPNPAAGSPADATPAPQQQPATPTTQPTLQPNEQPGAKQPSNDAQQPTDQPANAQNPKNSSAQNWPAPERYKSSRPGMNDSRSGQGASLGVSITGDAQGQGIAIMRVYPGTPAQQMGLRPRDQITSVNGQNVGSTDEFITVIRSMKPGDEVELGVVREDNPTTLRGKLEPFNQARLRAPIASGEDWSPNPLNNAYGQANSLRATSYEDRNQSGRSQSGDIEARLSRVEQQLSQLTRDVTEIRNSIRPNQSTSITLPQPSPAGQPSPRGSSPLQSTPGQPPNNGLNSLPPQSR
jgi:PDZ domain